MRDIIWTLIIIWLIYRLVDVFKSVTVKRSYVNTQQPHNPQQSNTKASSPGHSKRDMKSAMQKHLNNDGEYIDFEEVK